MRIGVVSGHDTSMIEDAKSIVGQLTNKGVEVSVEESLAKEMHVSRLPLRRTDADMLLVVGSDKTLLETLLKLSKKQVPVLPVASHGQPDFLFDVSVPNFENVIDDLVARRWSEDRRSRLAVRLGESETPPVLNELAVFAKRSATLIRYSLALNGELMWKDDSDGLLIATPTGSTAYSMSVGGPVVLNTAPVFTIIPVNSANPARRPLIVSDTTTIGINGISSRVAVEAVLDGQIRRPVEGTSIDVTRSPYDAVLVKLAQEKVAVLQGKLQKKTEILDGLALVLPPSAKLVLKVLEYHDYMTQREIATETKLPARTVRHALSILMSEGLVSKRLSLRDSRQGIFRVTESARKSPKTPR